MATIHPVPAEWAKRAYINADRYAEKYFDLDMYDRYLEQFEKRIESQGASVLDVACGPGNVSAYLAKVRPDLKLVGVSRLMVMLPPVG